MAEGGGLLNRYRVVKPYRGFESLRLRQRINKTNNLAENRGSTHDLLNKEKGRPLGQPRLRVHVRDCDAPFAIYQAILMVPTAGGTIKALVVS